VTFEIPMVPIPVADLNKHWTCRVKQRELWESTLLGFTSLNQRITLRDAARNKVPMRMDVTVYRARLFDDDNAVGALKPLCDALKHVGYIVDDRPEFFKLGEVKQVKCKGKEARTVITLEPI
jgi:hypothetical protein